jgi:hypothetical protein
LAARHEKQFADPKTSAYGRDGDEAHDDDEQQVERQALCIVNSKEGSLGLREADVVTLIKDEADSPLWYGERTSGEDGKVQEGYFEASSVVRLPVAPPPFPWEFNKDDGRLVTLHRGQCLPLANGLVYLLLNGVLAEDGDTVYWNAPATLGLGAVLGVTQPSPDPEAVICFSEVAHLQQLDLRPGAFFAVRLASDPLRARVLLEWMNDGLWKRLYQAWDDETLQMRIVRTRLEKTTLDRRFEPGLEMNEQESSPIAATFSPSKPVHKHRSSKAGSRRKSRKSLATTNGGDTIPRLNVTRQQEGSLKPDLFNMLTAVRGQED